MAIKKCLMKITSDMQLDIFEAVFLYAIERASFRWRLKAMIESRDRVDMAELDLKLRKLELEIVKKGGEDV